MYFRRRRRESAAARTDHLGEPGQPAPSPEPTDRATLLFAYEMLLIRQQTQATLLWQTPPLALTAQAFLLTIALLVDAATVGRVIAAVLGIAVALMSMQTMAKHRYFESLDNYQMQRLEVALGMPSLSSRSWANDAHDPLPGGFSLPRPNWFVRRRSYWVWQVGLGLFAAVNLAVIVTELIAHDVFEWKLS